MKHAARSLLGLCALLAACAQRDDDSSRTTPHVPGNTTGERSRARSDASVERDADLPSTDGSLVGDAEPTAQCDALGRDVSLQADVVLPWAADREGGILTATILHSFYQGQDELFVAEPQLRQISVLRGCDPYCSVSVLSNGLVAPLRATPVDFDGDGDRDVLVADIGLVQARVDPVGRVVLLVDDGKLGFRSRVLLDGVGRVACAEPADLDGDKDLDLTVCEFGAQDGSVMWLERTASGAFNRHELRREAGAIHAYPFDADGDGDLDIAVALSQKAQQVLLYRNSGGGQFAEEPLFTAKDERFGLTGIELSDLDRDGDSDVLIAAGDYFDKTFDFAQHGLSWLQNDGAGHFTRHEIIQTVGAYAVRTLDMDGDCDNDLVLAKLIVPELVPAENKQDPGLVWLENDGAQSFVMRSIAGAPEQASALAALHISGKPNLFTGSFSLGPASARNERLVRLRVTE